MSSKSIRGPYRVIEAAFELSAPNLASCPVDGLPEIAVAGRSNVGKSSLFNAFTGRRGLARVSRTPGRTRLLNFFRLRMQGALQEELGAPMRFDFRVVDLPGYGFAKARRSVRETFGPMIEGYLGGSVVLRGLIVLIDARRGPAGSDFDLLEYAGARSLPCLVCATKCDKVGAAERGLLPRRFADALGVAPSDVLLTSATSGLGLRDEGRHGGLPREIARLCLAGEYSLEGPSFVEGIGEPDHVG